MKNYKRDIVHIKEEDVAGNLFEAMLTKDSSRTICTFIHASDKEINEIIDAANLADFYNKSAHHVSLDGVKSLDLEFLQDNLNAMIEKYCVYMNLTQNRDTRHFATSPDTYLNLIDALCLIEHEKQGEFVEQLLELAITHARSRRKEEV